MDTIKNKQVNELVGGDISGGSNDRNVVSNSEIETGPVQKPFTDNSDYEVGPQTTTDKVASRYRQSIPWFAVYSYGGASRGLRNYVNEKNVIMICVFQSSSFNVVVDSGSKSLHWVGVRRTKYIIFW